MKKLSKIVIALVIGMAMLFNMSLTEVKADSSTWSLSYGVTWDGSKFVIDNTQLAMNGEVGVSVNISFPDTLTYNEGAVPTGWTATVGNGSVHYSLNGTNDDETTIKDFISQISFDGTYGTAGYIEIGVTDRNISSFAIGGVNHYYEFVEVRNPSIDWMSAYNQAKGRTYKGLVGYLTTITSQEEQDFVYNSIAKQPGWLGGWQMKKVADNSLINDENSISTNRADYDYYGKFYWVDGPEAGTVFWNGLNDAATNRIDGVYANWGQPINTQPDGTEECLEFAVAGTPTWNNLPYTYGDQHNQGYYVEYSPYNGMEESTVAGTSKVALPQPTPAPTPAPTSVPSQEEGGRTCQQDGYPAGYYWSDDQQACISNGVTAANANGYKVPNTAAK